MRGGVFAVQKKAQKRTVNVIAAEDSYLISIPNGIY